MSAPEELLKTFPALEPVIHRVETVNATIKSVGFNLGLDDQLAVHLEFDLDGRGFTYTLEDMDDIARFFKVVGVWALKQLPGQLVRVEYMSHASWTPFFRVWDLLETSSYLFAYKWESLERFARNEGAAIIRFLNPCVIE